MSHIFLCGIKHSGKTTIGKLLAKRLGRRWYDLDREIERKIGEPIRTFYRAFGQEAFQQLEVEVLEAIIGEENLVISLGGGAADNDPLMKMVKERGTLVYLYLEEAHLLERILLGGIPPFLDEEDVEGSFHRLYERRNRRYSKDCNHLIQLPFDQAKEENVELVLSSLGLKE
ncbi:MAG: Shikimate kinase [Spirochaetes bacterium ADurb.Bin315]|nr:MAG: Shikimate kinase [Spirochaetes bacterium ADurb.Bin315]